MKSDLLSHGTSSQATPGGGRHIVCVSGGLSSAWVARWVRDNIDGEKIYYFNDTKWEHPDLYRFLHDIEKSLGITITEDSDGRTPEQVFYDKKILGSNRSPVCSASLKAELTQKFVKSGDTLYFGIDGHELKRAARIAPIYARLGCECKFPLVDNAIHKNDLYDFLREIDVEIPQLYKDGFTHNNCGGGCVRAPARQWVSLLRKYPEVYADRERVEQEFSAWNNERRKDDPKYTPGDFSFMKDLSLKRLREIDENQIDFDFGPDERQGECVGICDRIY